MQQASYEIVTVHNNQELSTSSGLTYLRQVAQSYPVLEPDQEIALLNEWTAHRSKSAFKTLTLSHIHLVLAAVHDHKGYNVPEEDMAQEGVMGLMKAITKFKAEMGNRLAAYAKPWIDAAIKGLVLRFHKIVRIPDYGPMKTLFFGYQKALNAVGENPRMAAEFLGIQEHVVKESGQLMIGGAVSIEETVETPFVPVALIEHETPENHCEIVDENHRLHLVLASLKEREREIIQQRFLSDPPATLQSLAERFSVSVERVRQLEKQALEKMKNNWSLALK